MGNVIRKIMKCLKDSNMIRIHLKDFVALSKRFPSALFLPLFGLMEKIFITVEIDEVPAENGMSQREKRLSRRNSGLSRRNSLY